MISDSPYRVSRVEIRLVDWSANDLFARHAAKWMIAWPLSSVAEGLAFVQRLTAELIELCARRQNDDAPAPLPLGRDWVLGRDELCSRLLD